MTRVPLAHWPAGLPTTLTPPQGSLQLNLQVSALRYPDKAAMVFFGRSISYRERPVAQDVREEVRKLDEQILAMNDKLTANTKQAPNICL